MRDYRGKRLDGKGWVYGWYVKDSHGKHRIYWEPFDGALTYHFVDPATVGRVSDFRMAVGDIVMESPNGHIGLVIEEYGNFHIKWNDSYSNEFSWHDIVSDRLRRIEIIGNIHDNPELMESNNE